MLPRWLAVLVVAGILRAAAGPEPGYRGRQELETADAFQSLHGRPEFVAILEQLAAAKDH